VPYFLPVTSREYQRLAGPMLLNFREYMDSFPYVQLQQLAEQVYAGLGGIRLAELVAAVQSALLPAGPVSVALTTPNVSLAAPPP
jgi:hypothetical protein